jgi:hypothetical protein
MRTFTLLAAMLAVLGAPAVAKAQASGQARAVHASTIGPLGTMTTVTLTDTGTLSAGGDARDASDGSGSVAGLLSGNAFHASTVGSSETVASEASLGDLALSVAGNTVSAGFVMARALAGGRVGTAGAISIHGLSINGLPVTITGAKNQTISIPGGRIVINEQQSTGNSTVVNAIHVVVPGVADVVVASASAGIQ